MRIVYLGSGRNADGRLTELWRVASFVPTLEAADLVAFIGSDNEEFSRFNDI